MDGEGLGPDPLAMWVVLMFAYGIDFVVRWWFVSVPLAVALFIWAERKTR